MKRITILFFLLIIVNVLFVVEIQAANPKNTITVLPQLTQVDLSHDGPETTIYYTNNASYPVELSLSVQDVRELEDRNPVGILDPKEAANYKYSLSSWVYLDKQTVVLNPGETKPVKVTITKEKLSPGGHYGSVLAEIKAADTTKKTVKIKGVLASLLFVRASTGSEIEEAKIAFFGPSEQSISAPESFIFRFQNTGNVDLTPYGLVEVKDMRGRLVSKGIVNEDSLITLPEAIRKYSVASKHSNLILPGKYTATLSLHYGKSNKTITASSSFVTLGDSEAVKWIGVIAILIILIVTGNVILRRRLKKSSNS